MILLAIGCHNKTICADQIKFISPITGVYGGLSKPLIENCVSAGVDILYPSITWYAPKMDPKPLVDYAHKLGLKVIPSVAAAYDGYGENVSEFAKTHPQYWEKMKDGKLLNSGVYVNLSWGHEKVRQYKVKAITDFIVSNNFDGILLDYTRFFGNKSGYCDEIVNQFKAKFSIDPHSLPHDDPQWVQFRADFVTEFVTRLRQSLNSHNPELEIIACVGPDPYECLSRSCQDWLTWLNQGLLDGIVTMIYERDTNNTIESIAATNRVVNGKVPHYPMIACWGGNLNTPEMLKDGSIKSLKINPEGIAYYRSDTIRDLKLWPTIKEIANYSQQYIESQEINYILNSGFENAFEFYSVGQETNIAIFSDTVNQEEKSLKFTAGRNISPLRQLIDRGFIEDQSALQFSTKVLCQNTSANDHITIDVTVNYQTGREQDYQITHSCKAMDDWQTITANLHITNSKDIRFIIIAVTANITSGTTCLDELALNLTDKQVSQESYRLAGSSVSRENTYNANLALGQLTSSSSFWEIGFESSNAVDGNLSNENHGKHAAWHSQRPPHNQWLKIYLPQIKNITKIRLLNASAQYCYRTKDFKIETSIDDVNYTTVATGTLPNHAESWTELNIEPVAAKYLKFTGINSFHPDYSVGLKEIEIY
jgi:hypothetical protein